MITPLMLSRFLIKYRNTPVTTTGISNNERIYSYRPKILMDALITSPDRGNVEQKSVPIVAQKANDLTVEKGAPNVFIMRKSNNKTYQTNELVLYRSEFKNEVKWLRAKIIKILSKFRYTIELTTRGSRRDFHGDQLSHIS